MLPPFLFFIFVRVEPDRATGVEPPLRRSHEEILKNFPVALEVQLPGRNLGNVLVEHFRGTPALHRGFVVPLALQRPLPPGTVVV